MDNEDMYTASLDFGNKIALPNQKGQDAGLCKLITGLFKIDVCHGSILGGSGVIGMGPGGGDMLGGDVLGGPVGTCDGGGETTVT